MYAIRSYYAIAEALARVKPRDKKAAVDLEALLEDDPAPKTAQEKSDPFDFLNSLK